MPAALLQPLFAAEQQRWADALHWDLGPALEVLEAGRRTGRVAGLVLRRPSGRLNGWSFYVLQDDALQIGSLAAEDGRGIRLLLDAVLASPEAQLARRLTAFVFPQSSAVASALARRHFTVRRSLYLCRDLRDSAPRRPPVVRTHERVRLCGWSEADLTDIVRLLARAYDRDPGAELFAPGGTMAAWAGYVAQLLHAPGCGRFWPEGSWLYRTRDTGQTVAVGLATMIGPDTVHLAQMAVDPSARRVGLASRLLDAVAAAARRSGARRLTLLVDEHQEAALGLYRRCGFEVTNAFLAGFRHTPVRRHPSVRMNSDLQAMPA